MIKLRLLVFALMTAFTVTSGFANAEQKQTLGDWEVHYMVVNTSFLTPDVARAYDIARSNYKALVTVSVLDKGSKKAKTVSVSGTATNLLGTKKVLRFKRISEGDATYYLAILPFADREKYRFLIDIQNGNNRHQLKFNQDMFVD